MFHIDFNDATTWLVALGLGWALVLAGACSCLRLRRRDAIAHGRSERRHARHDRLARQLNDKLLQETQGLVLRFEAVARRIPKGDPLREMIDSALERADGVVVNARERALKLYGASSQSGDLPTAFATAANELSVYPHASCVIVVEGIERRLSAAVRHEVYRIGREMMMDALRDARAHRVEVEITHAHDCFRLRIRDDGDGFDGPARAGRISRHIDHLARIRGQARMLGANLVVWGRAGVGTEVELQVPAAIAYRRRENSCLDRFRHFIGEGRQL